MSVKLSKTLPGLPDRDPIFPDAPKWTILGRPKKEEKGNGVPGPGAYSVKRGGVGSETPSFSISGWAPAFGELCGIRADREIQIWVMLHRWALPH